MQHSSIQIGCLALKQSVAGSDVQVHGQRDSALDLFCYSPCEKCERMLA